jgi:hypothetical protein
MVMRATAWLTRLNGETSTACLRTVPWDPIRVESSRGPVLTIPSTRLHAEGQPEREEVAEGRRTHTWMGFSPVRRWTISKAWATIRTAICFFPEFLPFIMRLCDARRVRQQDRP